MTGCEATYLTCTSQTLSKMSVRDRVHPNSVVFITGQLGLGGAEKQLYLLVRGLLLTGWRASVITLNPGKGDYWERSFREMGVPLYEVSCAGTRLQRLLAIRRILSREGVPIVHSWTIHANFYAAAGGWMSGTPVRLGSERANHRSSRKALGHCWYALSLWGLDGLVVNSEPAAAFLRQYRPRLSVSIVPNGVVVADAPETKEQCRTRLGIPAAANVVGAVGSLVPRKNFASLITAFGLLAEWGMNALLVVIGDGPLRSDLEDQALRVLPKEKVLFVGALAGAENWYPAFDVLCMPSLDQEGTPNVLMEASAAGLPVVATAVGGAPTVVEDGRTGFLVPAGDVPALADRLGKLLPDSELRRRMGQAGREKMQREMSVESAVIRMRVVYEEALRRKGIA